MFVNIRIFNQLHRFYLLRLKLKRVFNLHNMFPRLVFNILYKSVHIICFLLVAEDSVLDK